MSNNHQQVNTIKKQTRLDATIARNVYRLKISPKNSKVIGGGGGFGTGFTIFSDKEVYLVTAAHLFEGIHVDDINNSIFIQHDNHFNNPIEVNYSKIGDCDSVEDDIAVFNINGASLCQEFNYNTVPISNYIIDPHEYNRGYKIFIGEQIIFAGYPSINYDLDFEEDWHSSHKGFPRPVLKFGYLSYFTQKPPRYYIDGTPNYGFSGGPIMYRNQNNEIRYLGVISGGTKDGGLGGLTMICGKITTVKKFINEIETEKFMDEIG